MSDYDYVQRGVEIAMLDEENACKEVLAYLVYKHLCRYLISFYNSNAQEAFVAGMSYAEAQKAYGRVTKRNSSADRAGLLSAFHATMGVLKKHAR